AAIGKSFEMDVVAWSQNLRIEDCDKEGIEFVGKYELLSRSDFVTLHVRPSERTRGLISGPEFKQMKNSSYLINTARSSIVDEAALIGALADGTIAGAGLDVFEVEPPSEDHPLF